MKHLRIYVDASVIGGCADEEFEEASRSLLQVAHRRQATLVVSDLLTEELLEAPAEVREVMASLPPQSVERVKVTAESEALCEAYLEAEVVGPSSRNDAHHVALATIARADFIVSWNFKHLVHFEKIRGFQAVNLREGYSPIEIHSPLEVV
jgi:predicted nucleic acid-binding protein